MTLQNIANLLNTYTQSRRIKDKYYTYRYIENSLLKDHINEMESINRESSLYEILE